MSIVHYITIQSGGRQLNQRQNLGTDVCFVSPTNIPIHYFMVKNSKSDAGLLEWSGLVAKGNHMSGSLPPDHV